MEKVKKWTYGEFFDFIEKKVIAENPEFKDFLDYCYAHYEVQDEFIVSDELSIKAEVEFGSNEGVYANITTTTRDNKFLGTAKTLYEGDDAFRKMSRFACEFVLAFNNYIYENNEEFDYTGFRVGRKKADGSIAWTCWIYKHEHAISRAKEFAQEKLEEGQKVVYVVRDNATRKIQEVIAE